MRLLPELQIILNLHAASGATQKRWPQMNKALKKAGFHFHVFPTQNVGHAATLATQIAQQIPDVVHHNFVILVIGGDGTLNEVLNGLFARPRQFSIPISYLPSGSGNDFARGGDIPRQWQKAIDELRTVQTAKTLVVGSYQKQYSHQNHYFLNNIGIGYDARIVALANRSQQKNWLNQIGLGSLTYLFASIKALRQQQSFPITLAEGKNHTTLENAFLVTITNHPYFCGGIKLSPKSSVSESALELVVVQSTSKWQLFKILLGLKVGSLHLKSKHTTLHTFKNPFELQSPSAQFIQIDGETTDPTPTTLRFSTATYPFWIK